MDVIDPFWAERSAAEGYSDTADHATTDNPSGRNRPASLDPASSDVTDLRHVVEKWVRDAEDLIAMEVIAFVSQTTVQLKNLAYYLAIAPILLLLAVGSYPFQPQRFLQVSICSILFMVMAGVILVYVWMEKDEFISRISRTTPNQVSLDRTFLGNLLAFVIPIAGIAVAQFPFFSDSLNQWLEPITRVLK